MILTLAPFDTAPLYSWLVERLAVYLERRQDSIDPGIPLAEYGMDSVAALSLCGDVEDEFALAVEPSLVWDHPTVHALAAHLAARGARPAPGRPG